MKDANIKSYLGAPIFDACGEIVGILCAIESKPYRFSTAEIEGLVALANILTNAHSQYNHSSKEIEEKIIRLEKLSMVGQLAAGIAHEIRNPLQSIKGFIQLLFDDSTEHVRYQKIVDEEINRIDEIITEFLLAVKPTSPHKKEVSMEDIMIEAIRFMKNEALLHSVELTYTITGTIPLINVDKNQIKQVLVNIIKNAIEAAKNESGEIKVDAFYDPNYITIQVKDNGLEVPIEVLTKMGYPFFTTKDEGTGLGLAVSKKIIEAHNGQIRFESTPEGTTVIIQLLVE